MVKYFTIFLLYFSLALNAEYNYEIVEEESFWYVYEEYYGYKDWSIRAKEFQKELEIQNLNNILFDELLVVHFDNHIQHWAYGFKIDKKVLVKHPLKINYQKEGKVLRNIHYGSVNKIGISLWKSSFYIDRNYYRYVGPSRSMPLNNYPGVPENDVVTEISIPIITGNSISIFARKFKVESLVISAFLFFLLALYLFFNSRSKTSSNIYLGLFLLIKAIIYLDNLLFYYHIHLSEVSVIYSVSIYSIEYITGPLLFFYTLSLLQQKFKPRFKHAIHFIPLIIRIIYLIVILSSEMGKEWMKEIGIIPESLTKLIFKYAFYCLYIGYIIASLLLLIKAKIKLKDQFSTLKKVHISWLGYFLTGLLIFMVYNIVLLIITFPVEYDFIVSIFQSLYILAFVSLILIKGLKQNEIFSQIDLRIKPERTSISNILFRKYKEALNKYIEEEKPYLNPELTFPQLSANTKIPPSSLSEIINRGYNENFFDFINRYRVEEAKKLLLSPKTQYYSILQILYHAGFNSKSAFNRAFKKHTGMSPTVFKKQSVA